MISLVLLGAAGRMGRAIEEAAAGAADLRIKARVDRSVAAGQVAGPRVEAAGYGIETASGPSARGENPGWSTLEEAVSAGDVVVDFSAPEGTRQAAQVCAAQGAALVTGTTGVPNDVQVELERASARVAVLQAANFSMGLLALRRAIGAALDVLGSEWDVEVVERHHRRKVDSPSGTALQLANAVAARRGLGDRALRFGREGHVGPRPRDEIGIHAVRGGSWVGDHAVLIAAEGEWLELRHVAQSREAFAQGVLHATRFVAAAAAGLYHLEDVLIP